MAVAEAPVLLRDLSGTDTCFAHPEPEVEADQRLRFGAEESTGGLLLPAFDFGATRCSGPWRTLGRADRIYFIPSGIVGEGTMVLGDRDATWVPNAPKLDPLSDRIKLELERVARRAADVWVNLQLSAVAPTVLDVPARLQDARLQSGLPVQDLAEMFGVKRRQFYNLMNGGSPSLDTERRVGPVADAIARLYSAAGSDSHAVRTAILAPIDGESLFEAAVSGDLDRLRAAADRAVSALTSGSQLRRPVPPSHRATPEAVAAAREESRFTRDQMGFGSDGS